LPSRLLFLFHVDEDEPISVPGPAVLGLLLVGLGLVAGSAGAHS